MKAGEKQTELEDDVVTTTAGVDPDGVSVAGMAAQGPHTPASVAPPPDAPIVFDAEAAQALREQLGNAGKKVNLTPGPGKGFAPAPTLVPDV